MYKYTYIPFLADRMLCGYDINGMKEREKTSVVLRDRIKTDYTWGFG